MRKRFSLLCFMLFAIHAVFAQGKWELKKNENGIQIFTRKAAVGNVKELRVLCELDVTQAQLINTILDIGNYNSWIYANKKSVILKTESPSKIIYYTQSHLPWPIKDRDLVVELNIYSTPENLNIQVKSIPDVLAKNPDYIRVPYSLATWNVTQAANNKLKIDYTFSVDPGGSIPSWIVNATLTIGPYNSFLKLKELLKAKYGK
jgi:hypothetical protein